ncbi:hypothetical protein ASD64_14225 [Mesorhizobium sp. Root157]|uniref:DUF1697 domain-containing protein n=1 Tax=Mesorhizobium sp. Root157 TaxID=1736477 RepID=UPI0006F81D8E|nr:DUF1697 domain-containing protein [Mesorhizobium sp. Root157]KQZ99498.1 hypothetical protein ASD64_14225 [Mesorhizobium sp. Root157]
MSGKSERHVFIVLFRGVGGATQLPTAPLRKALGEAGFGDVSTYINSGNAILSSTLGSKQTHARIAEIVKRKFGFEKDVMLVERNHWQRIIRENPFPDAGNQPTTMHVFVLAKAPDRAAVEALSARAVGGERLEVRNNVLYLHVPDSFCVSKLPPVIDRVLGTVSTARNWRTVQALGKMAAEVG